VLCCLSTDTEKAVAWLHDAIYSCGISKKMLRGAFTDDIADAVWTLTRRDNEDYFDYIRGISQNPLASAVKLAGIKRKMDSNSVGDIKRTEKHETAYQILTNN
jgi:(p)ppGpp synthase/HD superfamily hydrolase